MLKKVIYVFVFMFVSVSLAQNYTKHTVAEGETISKIALLYKVTPYEIYKLNPDSQNGVKPNSVLLIPNGKTKSIVKTSDTKPVVAVPTDTKPIVEKTKEVKISEPKPVITKPKADKPVVTTLTHTVKSGDNLYNLAKQYKVSVSDLEKNNPTIIDGGLQLGQKLIIKKGVTPAKTEIKKPVIITHEVLAKETKYGIATKYGVSVEELEKQNPEVVESLPIGYQLKIDTSKKNDTTPKIITPKEIVVEPKPKEKPLALFDYTVKAGETFYSLSRLFGLSQEKLTELNPELINGVKDGMILKVPANISFTKETKSNFIDLSKSIVNQEKKNLVLLLPFNIAKIEKDSLNSIANKLKEDKFLNMTLDFYSGALMAIDSAKVLGLNIDVSIYDSEETKTSTNAVTILQEKAPFAHAVIGPFYQSNIEKVAEALETKNIPVISPLSKEVDKSFKNLYTSMPTGNPQKKAMFDYMNSKNGNIVAIIEPKKSEIKQYIQSNYSDTKIVNLNEKVGFVSDSIKMHFVKDKMNFVVMESEKVGTIFTTINTMKSAMTDYQVQLVILEPNETLEYEEIALNNLTKLKLTYPSLTRENESPEATVFERNFRKKNKVLPNQYAVRGFDVTFDTMLRLSQAQSFEETIKNTATEQIESKFDYASKVSGGYANNGVYILYYDTDLTIKQAQ